MGTSRSLGTKESVCIRKEFNSKRTGPASSVSSKCIHMHIALRATPLSLPDTLGLSATYTYECHLHSNACLEGGSIGSRIACAGVSCKQKGTKTAPLWDHYLER